MGVILFVVGLVVKAGGWKIAFLLAACALASSIFVMQRRRHSEDVDLPDDDGISPSGEPERAAMRKLVFDDLQSAGKQYRIDFLDDSGQRVGTGSPAPPATARRNAEATTSVEFRSEDFLEASDGDSAGERGARSEFRTVMLRLLTVLKEVHFARSVCLYWVNTEKQQLVLETHVTDSPAFTAHGRRELGSDILSQVARTGKPQLVNYLEDSGERDVLPYYDAPEPVKTAVAVPIFYAGATTAEAGPVAILALDCLEDDAYGPETMALLARFAKLISSLIRTYTDKYDMLVDSEVLRSLGRLRDQFSMEFSAPAITRALAEESSRLIPWDYISVVVYDDTRKAWIVQQVLNRMNDPYVPLLAEVDLQRSLVGSVVQSSAPKVVDRCDALGVPRFYQAERCEAKGSLMAIPLTSLSRCYGAVVVESKDPGSYSDSDVRLIQRLTETASWALEVLSLTEVMNNFVALDETTGVSTRRHFLERLQEEVQRATDFNNDLAVVMISVDRLEEQTSRHGKDALDVVLQSIGQMIKSSMRQYDVVGRFDVNRFGVVLVQTNANEATLWAEKIRKNVASNIINIDNKSFTVTISVGVAGPSAEMTDLGLLENAERVLKKAVEAGGNLVRVY
jgi:diguanylate cyclase (GGDEF)-like protein